MSGSVIVCGGRDYADRVRVHEVLSLHIPPHATVIHGGARGADTLAGEWADANGFRSRVYLARWQKEGKAAGVLRNQRMLEQERPVLVVAFPGGKGTKDMVARAKAAGVPVVEACPAFPPLDPDDPDPGRPLPATEEMR